MCRYKLGFEDEAQKTLVAVILIDIHQISHYCEDGMALNHLYSAWTESAVAGNNNHKYFHSIRRYNETSLLYTFLLFI
jgi:hypothetical protein